MFKEIKNQRLYLQIVNQVRDLIAKGNLKAGDKPPPERELTEIIWCKQSIYSGSDECTRNTRID